jgi:hypothetical protein
MADREQKFMKQNRKIIIILTGFILVALIVSGIIRYSNDSGGVSPNQAQADDALATDVPAEIDLVYCSSPASLCVISFGSDNAGNMLIVIKNNIPNLAEFYAKINQTGHSNLYTCQKVQFTRDVYYCLGSQILDGTMVTMDAYSKNDDRLVASGSILVSLESTPMPIITKRPIGTSSSSATPSPVIP